MFYVLPLSRLADILCHYGGCQSINRLHTFAFIRLFSTLSYYSFPLWRIPSIYYLFGFTLLRA